MGGAAAALCLYVVTLGPTITGEDSGEFVVAAYALGIPHPPGYPLYCLLGHLFTWIPIGEVAWRVNLMSAVFASGAVFVLALTVLHLTRSRLAAFGAALAFACSREFWAQSVIAEVYTMNLFFIALCLLLLLCWSESRRDGTLYLFAFFFGLGITVHNTFLLLIPPCALYVLALDLQAARGTLAFWSGRFKTYLFCCLIATSALLLYLYLPLRSSANPPLDWGNPETLETMVRHIRRVQYDFMFSQYPRSLGRFAGQMLVYGRFWLGEFIPVIGLFGAAGLAWLLWKRTAYALLLLSSALVILGGFAFWQNFEHTREWLWVMRVFAIPAYYVTAIGIGCALAAFFRSKHATRAVGVILTLLAVLGPVTEHFQRNNKSDYYWTRDYGANLLNTLEKDAIYVSESDHASFSILYLQTVFGMRPDVENLRKYGYLQSDLFREMPDSLREKIGPFPPRRHDPEIIAWLLEHTDRPIYLAKPMRLPTTEPVRFVPAGLAFRALRPGESPAGHTYWERYEWQTLSIADTRHDYTADAILCEIQLAEAQGFLMQSAEHPETKTDLRSIALSKIEEALLFYGRDPVMLNNAGVLCARYGLYEHARDYFEEALNALPHMAEAKRNLERVQNILE